MRRGSLQLHKPFFLYPSHEKSELFEDLNFGIKYVNGISLLVNMEKIWQVSPHLREV